MQIDLVVDGTSTLRVTTDKELRDDEVVLALYDAGEFKLASVLLSPAERSATFASAWPWEPAAT